MGASIPAFANRGKTARHLAAKGFDGYRRSMTTSASLGRLPAALLTLAVLATAWPAAAQAAAPQQLAQPPPAAAAVPTSADAHVNALIDARVKDSKLVEYEVSEAIAERMIKWAQWFALLVGAPLAILALVLTLFGIRSYADFQDRMKKAREAIAIQMQKAVELQAAHEAIDRQLKDAASLQTQFTALREHLTELSKLDQDVQKIAQRVDQLGQFVGFEKSAALTPELKASLESTLGRYRTWLARIGAQTKRKVTVLIDRKEKNNAYYVNGKIVIAEVLSGDPDVLLRTYTHHVLEAATRRSGAPLMAVHYGLADYFPCSFKDNPLFGVISAAVYNKMEKEPLFPDGYIRSMENQLRVDGEVTFETQGLLGLGWAGAFWEIRKLLGAPQADPLLFEAWKAARVVGEASSAAFGRDTTALVEARYPKHEAAVRAIFERRGLDLAKSQPARARATAKAGR
jgi:hypothetical protein